MNSANTKLLNDYIPCIGTKVDTFFEPLPKVTNIIAWPSDEKIKRLGISGFEHIDAIIIVG